MKTYILYFENVSCRKFFAKLVPILCFWWKFWTNFEISHFWRTRWQKATCGCQNTEDSSQILSLSAQLHQMLNLASICILVFILCPLENLENAFHFECITVIKGKGRFTKNDKVIYFLSNCLRSNIKLNSTFLLASTNPIKSCHHDLGWQN